jgi:quinol monooxygenase YgiN
MVYVFTTIKVDDYNVWKTAFDKRSATREESGAKEAHLFRDSDDDNKVAILFEWDNISNARKYMESDIVRKYLKNVGAEIVNVSYLEKQEISI